MEHQARPIRNPFAGHDDYHCFGCDPDNPVGLRLEFQLEGEEVTASWEPRQDLEGFPGIIHGGIQATLADEIAGWYVMVAFGTAGVTKSMEIRYLRPAMRSDGPFVLRARGADGEEAAATDGGETPGRAGRMPDARVRVSLENSAGAVCTEADCVFTVFNEKIARKRFHYPGRDALVEES